MSKKSELVEIELHYEMPAYVPARAEDGELTYKKVDIAPNHGHIKVRVPSYATESKKALSDYLVNHMMDACCDIISFDNPNIWDTDEKHEDGGEFRFEWSCGQFDW